MIFREVNITCLAESLKSMYSCLGMKVLGSVETAQGEDIWHSCNKYSVLYIYCHLSHSPVHSFFSSLMGDNNGETSPFQAQTVQCQQGTEGK